MPTMLEWDFEGGEDGSRLAARRGKQRVHFGDTVIDEVMTVIDDRRTVTGSQRLSM